MPQPRITLALAHSPDADDLVMWWPLTGIRGPDGTPVGGDEGRPAIDTGPFAFEPVADDVERLNRRAISAGPDAYDITAISCRAYADARHAYAITACGGSFGDGYGPCVVVRPEAPINCEGCLKTQRPTVAVPGRNTTAFLVLSLVIGEFTHEEMLFSEIPDAVASGRVGAGLLIHEAQIAFERLGLRAVLDLGAWWKDETGLPLPLGLNVVRRDLDARCGSGTVDRVAELLRASVAHARANPERSAMCLRFRGDDRPEWQDPTLVRRYLDMYVNDMTADMGDRGREAIAQLLKAGHKAGLCHDPGVIDVR